MGGEDGIVGGRERGLEVVAGTSSSAAVLQHAAVLRGEGRDIRGACGCRGRGPEKGGTRGLQASAVLLLSFNVQLCSEVKGGQRGRRQGSGPGEREQERGAGVGVRKVLEGRGWKGREWV